MWFKFINHPRHLKKGSGGGGGTSPRRPPGPCGQATQPPSLNHRPRDTISHNAVRHFCAGTAMVLRAGVSHSCGSFVPIHLDEKEQVSLTSPPSPPGLSAFV